MPRTVLLSSVSFSSWILVCNSTVLVFLCWYSHTSWLLWSLSLLVWSVQLYLINYLICGCLISCTLACILWPVMYHVYMCLTPACLVGLYYLTLFGTLFLCLHLNPRHMEKCILRTLRRHKGGDLRPPIWNLKWQMGHPAVSWSLLLIYFSNVLFI